MKTPVLGVRVFEGLAYDAVHVAVERLNDVGVAVEHVLHAVGGIEYAGDYAAACVVERAEIHGFALGLYQFCLAEEVVVSNRSVIERPGIFGQAESRVSSQ